LNYLCVQWLHEYPTEPVRLFSELDDQRWETRKIATDPQFIAREITKEEFEEAWDARTGPSR
jgi:hypothetical protein